MASSRTQHTFRKKWAALVANIGYFANVHSLVVTAQIVLVFGQMTMLTFMIDWLVSSLLHLPLLVTMVAVLIVSIPAFFIFWMMHKALENIDKANHC